jgi:hypothetical protein
MNSDREKAMDMLEKVGRDFRNAMTHLTGAEPAYALFANLRTDLDRAIALLKKDH